MICTAEGNSRPIAGFLPKTSISLREFLTASLFHLPLHTLYRTTRICEATLSRTEEECHPTVRGVRAGESVLGAEKTVALGTGLARERRLLITGEPPKQAEDRKKPNPSACTGLAEHLLPRRHGLIQSFPSAATASSVITTNSTKGVVSNPGTGSPNQLLFSAPCPPVEPASPREDMIRYFNLSTLDHFYTANYSELGCGGKGYGLEEIGFEAFSSQQSGSVPLYRYWNQTKGFHFYTTNFSEL